MDIFDKLEQTGKDFVASVKGITDTGAIKIKIVEREKQIEKMYALIGKKYISLAGENPAPELAAEINELKKQIKKLNELKQEINSNNNIVNCPKCKMPCEKYVIYCPHCGNKM